MEFDRIYDMRFTIYATILMRVASYIVYRQSQILSLLTSSPTNNYYDRPNSGASSFAKATEDWERKFMIDLIQVQKDLYGLLMSAPQLATVNIVEERKFIMESQIEMDAIWQTQRPLSGINYSGNGLLIEVPDIICDSDGVSGPPQQVELSFVSFQNGDGAFIKQTAGGGLVGDGDTPSFPIAGGGLFAEQIEQHLIDIVHLLTLGGIGTMKVVARFSSPARDYPGINARRTKIIMTPKQTAQTLRTATIQNSIAGGSMTLTCATPGAAIYYTLDGSFPSNPTIAIKPLSVTAATPNGEPVNPNSNLYVAPFAVQSGQCVRAAAYLNGYNPGQIIKINVP
jgi:hypothetical protein